MLPGQRPSVAVLGAGLTGVSVALELARQGGRIALIEQDEIAVNRASLRNEGKIHLGLIYAAEGTLETASLQLQGALEFLALLSRWIGARADHVPQSTPFTYLVATDSLRTPNQLEEHYAAVEALYLQRLRERPELRIYLGGRPARLYDRCAERDIAPLFFNPARVSAVSTPPSLRSTATRLPGPCDWPWPNSSRIEFHPRRKVLAVEQVNGAFRIEGTGPEGTWVLKAEQVVNALWENRLAIDRTVGLQPAPGWLYRLKYRVIARLPEHLLGAPSATMVLGRYGDVVVRPDGTAYLSWYPKGLRGWSHDIAPPEDWLGPCRGEVSPTDARAVAIDLLAAIDEWYPGMGQSQPLLVDAGVIVAYGHTDVDDAKSGLHGRIRVGVRSADGYHSVDPGKLTTAPLFAKQAAERVVGAALTA